MAVFGPIVQTCGRPHEDMFGLGQCFDTCFGGGITAQLIRYDDPRCRVAAQDRLEESFGRSGIAVFLQKDIEFLPLLVNGTPEPVRLTTQAHEHLVKIPCRRDARNEFHPTCKLGAKFTAPRPYRFVADDHAALEQ